MSSAFSGSFFGPPPKKLKKLVVSSVGKKVARVFVSGVRVEKDDALEANDRPLVTNAPANGKIIAATYSR
jgi:hypothetical protein